MTLDRQRMEMDHARQRGRDSVRDRKSNTRLAALQVDLENAQGNLLIVACPLRRQLLSSVAQRNAGSVVQQGPGTLPACSPRFATRARASSVDGSGLPKLAVGQRVRFFFDAFPYQRYGAVNGKLDWISPSAVTSPEGPHFVALASLDEDLSKRRRKPLSAARRHARRSAHRCRHAHA